MTPHERLVRELSELGVTHSRAMAAIRRVDRARFVPDAVRDQAYVNIPLAIGLGQTISQPLVVGLMTQALDPQPDDRVLEVGTGSGYQTAILAELAGEVISIERHPRLANRARLVLAGMGYTNIAVHSGSGSAGWPHGAPYDRILVTAGTPRIPIHLVAELSRPGRLVAPIGTKHEQRLIVIDKVATGLEERDLGPVRFVPLIGQDAWQE